MKRIGITGQNGFIGNHLFNTLGLFPEEYERIEFRKSYFDDEIELDRFVSSCDVIVHLAAVNRHESEQFIFETNIDLVQRLINSLKRTKSKAHIVHSSSTQELKNNLYGKSKKEGRELFNQWAIANGGKFTGLIIPNVFGPFGRPFYNSFIPTFCDQLINNQTPTIIEDANVALIYVHELVIEIINLIKNGLHQGELFLEPTSSNKVSEILLLLKRYKLEYFEKGVIPNLKNDFEQNLFNTFRSFINYKTHFPIKLLQHKDPRGSFVEIARIGIGGQCSFSTTVPGITRGNHFHTRKIERFAVIKGKALIQLRKIDEKEVFDFYIDGAEPAYVDMPIWFTHNIKNIGEEELYTIFWINEAYNPNDPDTYMLEV